MAKELRSFPLAAGREIVHLPLGYAVMHVGNLHGMTRLYVQADWSNRTIAVDFAQKENSFDIPDGFEYVGTVEGSTGYTHVYATSTY